MWFGDLVTMRWWDDAWLNESFAEWVSFRAVDELSPDYDVWGEFALRVGLVLETDALAHTHPIYQPVDTPVAIEENFDEITYAKGCAVLRMVEQYLGNADFRAGIRTYMQEFAEGNATGADLWRHLQSASSAPVTEMIQSWVLQPGHPIVRMELKASESGSSLRLSQRRFFGHPGASDGNTQLWHVPLVIRYQDDTGRHEYRCLLSERDVELPLAVSGTLAWCTVNAGDTGFYRQDPDASLLAGLVAHLDELHPVEQAALLRDQWALVQSGSQSISSFLDTLVAVANSDDYRVIRQMATILRMLEIFLLDAGDTGAQALLDYRAWIVATFGSKLARLGYQPRADESARQAQVRGLLLDIVIRFGHDPAAIQQARAAQAREATDPLAVDANLASIVVGAAAQFGDEALQRQYLAIYQQRRAAGASPQQVGRYVSSFYRFQHPEMIERTFQWMDEGVFPFQDMLFIIRPMIQQWGTRKAAWAWIKSHWDSFDGAVGGAVPFVTPLIVQATGNLPGELRPEVEAFFAEHLHGELQSSVAQALEEMTQSDEVEVRTRDALVAWFNGRHR
jgi:aminopeptidase N